MPASSAAPSRGWRRGAGSAGAVSYSEFQPERGLRRIVETFWAFRSESRALERVAPDGRCELVVHLGEPYLEVSGPESLRQPRSLLAAQLTRPLHLQGSGAIECISARIAPAAAATILHGDASVFTDRRVDLRALDPAGAQALLLSLSQAADDGERVARLARYVAQRCRDPALAPDGRVERAIRWLETREPPSAAELARDLALSTRQLERLFRRSVGVSPRLYGSIVRFRRIFDALAAGAASLSDAAQATGYSDHPQMARDFQRFLGCSASQFLRERAQLSAAMTRGRALP